MSGPLIDGPAGAPAALAYLLAPVVLFWGFYIRGPLGMALALLPLAWAGWLWHLGRFRGAIRGRDWTVGLLWTLPVLAVMGFPYGPWASDWFKHWALLGALADQSWPVRLELQGESWVMRFYFAAYLVPAVLAKAGVPLAAAAASWFGLGVAILIASIARRAHAAHGKSWAFIAPALFLLLAGADGAVEYLLRTLTHWSAGGAPPPLGLHTEWWALDFLETVLQYTGMLAALSWVPHQSIATFLVAAAMSGGRLHVAPWTAGLGMAALSLWSPLGLLGLLPVFFLRLATSWREWAGPGAMRWQTASGALLLLPLVGCTARFMASEMPATGFSLPDAVTLLARLRPSLLFAAVELAPCALLLGNRLWRDPLLRLCTATLLTIPLLGGGEPPDFVMRASMGPLAILMLEAVHAVPARWAEGRHGIATILIGLLLSVPTSLNEALYHLDGGAAHRSLPPRDPMANPARAHFAQDAKTSVTAFFDECGWRYLPQYFARRPAYVAAPQ